MALASPACPEGTPSAGMVARTDLIPEIDFFAGIPDKKE
jgi:hypothetical protein